MPKVHVVTVVEIKSITSDKVETYNLLALVTKFTTRRVRPRIDKYIRITRQLAPLTPPLG